MSSPKRTSKIVITLLLTLLTTNTFGKPYSSPNLTIIYINDKVPVPTIPENQLNNVWLDACNILAPKLTEAGGPYGTGSFKATECESDASEENIDWKLTLKQDKNQIIQFELVDNNKTSITKFTLPTAEFGPLLIKDPDISSLIALRISDALPIAGIISTKTLGNGNKLNFKAPKTRILPKHPYSEIKIFAISTMREDLLIPQIIASAKIQNEQTNSVQYQLVEESEDRIPPGKFYFQQANGPDSNKESIETALSVKSKEIADKLRNGYFATFTRGLWPIKSYRHSGGDVSLSFSKETFPAEEPLKNTMQISIDTDIEFSDLNSLNYNFDIVPKQQSSFTSMDGNKTEIAWNRHLIGGKFTWDLGFFADSMEISPKIGLWNFKGRLDSTMTSTTGEALYTATYTINNNLSAAFESSLNWKAQHTQIKLWYEFATSINFPSKSDRQGVYSSEAGVDLILQTGPQIRFLDITGNLAIFAFTKIHLMTLQGGKYDSQQKSNDVNLSGGYTGVGAAISW